MSKGRGWIGYRRFLMGDNAALEETVRLYSDALVRFAHCYVKDSALAEDLMEDAFVTLILKRIQFEEEEQLRAYLYKTVRSKCLDYLRKNKRLVPLTDFSDKLIAEHTEHTLLEQERAQEVRRALEKLPGQYQEVLQLTYYGELGVAAICEALGKSQKQVYNLLARAKAALGKVLKKEGIFYENL